MKNIIVTIDGPAASGKEKISKFISKKWKLKHLDSGILYRRLTQILLNNRIDLNDIDQIKKAIQKIKIISFRKSKKIRTQEIGKLASNIAVYDFVRDYINRLQRNLLKLIKIIKVL